MTLEDQEVGTMYFKLEGVPDDYSGISEIGYHMFVKGGEDPPPYSIPEKPMNVFSDGELIHNWSDAPSPDRKNFNTDIGIAAVDSACNYSKLSNIYHLSDYQFGCSTTNSKGSVLWLLVIPLLVRVLTRRWSGMLRAL